MDKHWWNYYVNNRDAISTCVGKFGSINDLIALDRATTSGQDDVVEDILTKIWGKAPATADVRGYNELCALLDGTYEEMFEEAA